jgi:hypothetical protein
MIITETMMNGIKITTSINDESDMTTEQQKTEWLSICDTCQFRQGDICSYIDCKCILETIMMLKTSKCPINKW